MIIPIIVAAVVTIIVLGIGETITTVGPWYRNLRKPSWNSAGVAVWTSLDSHSQSCRLGQRPAWTNAPDDGARVLIIVLYAVHIVFHLLWTPLFFNLRRPDWALIEVPFLWLSVLALMIGLAPMSSLAVWLLLPYLLCGSFAAFLNYTIVRINSPFSASSAG